VQVDGCGGPTGEALVELGGGSGPAHAAATACASRGGAAPALLRLCPGPTQAGAKTTTPTYDGKRAAHAGVMGETRRDLHDRCGRGKVGVGRATAVACPKTTSPPARTGTLQRPLLKVVERTAALATARRLLQVGKTVVACVPH